MLAIREIAPYLLRQKLISPKAIVEGDLLISDATHRNCNYKVVSQHGPCYLLKQGIGPFGCAMVLHEAHVYQHLHMHGKAHGLQSYLPFCHGYDPQAGVLILELLRNAESVSARYREGRFSTAIASAIGDALGSLHRMPWGEEEEAKHGRELLASPPWVLSIHRPHLSLFREVSGANLQLIKLIQNSPEFCQLLDRLRNGWQKNALIHHDVKSENIVVFAPSTSRRRTAVALIDWESAQSGDACWDAASVFSDYLSFWLFSIPITGQEPPERFLELASYPLEKIQQAIRVYWQSYVRRMGFDEAMAHQRLLRSVQYSAARLVQTGYEQMQMSRQLTGTVVGLLQLSMNILQRPLEASVYLYGIPLQPARAA